MEWLSLSREGHGVFDEQTRKEVYEQILDFLDRHLPVGGEGKATRVCRLKPESDIVEAPGPASTLSRRTDMAFCRRLLRCIQGTAKLALSQDLQKCMNQDHPFCGCQIDSEVTEAML
jgi:hypothetical protein